MTDITVQFSYDNTRGVFSAQINGGQRFYFSGHRDAVIPQALANALASLRTLTMLEARERRTRQEVLPLGKVLALIEEYERSGGKISRPATETRKVVAKLNLTDLELEI